MSGPKTGVGEIGRLEVGPVQVGCAKIDSGEVRMGKISFDPMHCDRPDALKLRVAKIS